MSNLIRSTSRSRALIHIRTARQWGEPIVNKSNFCNKELQTKLSPDIKIKIFLVLILNIDLYLRKTIEGYKNSTHSFNGPTWCVVELKPRPTHLAYILQLKGNNMRNGALSFLNFFVNMTWLFSRWEHFLTSWQFEVQGGTESCLPVTDRLTAWRICLE